MILYRLRCNDDHEFEAWFQNGDAFEKQAESGLLSCPACGSSQVTKALMAPAVRSTKRDRPVRSEAAPPDSTPTTAPTPAPAKQVTTEAAELKRQLLTLRRVVEQNCDPVGDRFAEEARKIHYGETEARGIYGDTTADEAAELREEGIEFGTLPWVREDA